MWLWRNSPGCSASSPGTSTRATRAGSDAAGLVPGYSRPRPPAPVPLPSNEPTPPLVRLQPSPAPGPSNEPTPPLVRLQPSPAPYGLMSAFRTPGSGTVASALGTARIDCSTPPFPLPVITRPAYSGPEPASGVTITAKAVPLRDPDLDGAPGGGQHQRGRQSSPGHVVGDHALLLDRASAGCEVARFAWDQHGGGDR